MITHKWMRRAIENHQEPLGSRPSLSLRLGSDALRVESLRFVVLRLTISIWHPLNVCVPLRMQRAAISASKNSARTVVGAPVSDGQRVMVDMRPKDEKYSMRSDLRMSCGNPSCSFKNIFSWRNAVLPGEKKKKAHHVDRVSPTLGRSNGWKKVGTVKPFNTVPVMT